MSVMDYAISARNITKTFKDLTAVKDLQFQVRTAECFGFLGPNGAGKTTMMKILIGRCRRDNPEAGQISVFGYDPLDCELEIKYLAGVVPQEDNLDTELSVRQNLSIYAGFYGISKKTAAPRIDYLINFMEQTEKADSKIRELSGGMKRRLIIARALINEPKLLILDEPTTGLDPQVRHLIWDKLRMLKKEGVTILLTTHYMEEAYQICDRLIIMHGGEKVLEGEPGALIKEHIEQYVLEILDRESAQSIEEGPQVRRETTDSRVLLYSDDISVLEGVTGGYKAGDFYLRQSNLEDLFLKTTGRNLDE
jgi:lipooligosaccharide transport system ATP-binding protein